MELELELDPFHLLTATGMGAVGVMIMDMW